MTEENERKLDGRRFEFKAIDNELNANIVMGRGMGGDKSLKPTDVMRIIFNTNA